MSILHLPITMELTSQPDLAATESFSYSWLSNAQLPDHLYHLGFNIPFRASNFKSTSHETTSKCLFSKENSKRYSELETQNFDFNVPAISQYSSSNSDDHQLVHADELFSNGIIKPVFKSPQRVVSNSNNPLIPFSSASSSSIRTLVPTHVEVNCHFFRRWKRTVATGRILRECFRYLCRPLCRSRKCTRVDDIDRRSLEVKSWSSSPQLASPEQQRSADMESSLIHEAVLHCKRSIEK